MPTLIELHAGVGWYSSLDLEDVDRAIEDGAPIDIWWFSPWGQRFSERALIPRESVAYLRTESDDG